MQRIVVTGLGMINSVGNSVKESFSVIVKGVCGIDKISLFDSTNISVQIAGEVKNFDSTAVLGKKEAKKADRFIQLGIHAAKEAMKDAKIVINNNKPSIIERIKFWIILVISFYTFILISYNAINLFLEFNHQSEQIITQETERQKKIAKNAVNEAIDLIELHLEFLKNTKYPNRDISELFSNEFLQANFPPQSENELIQKDIKNYQNILLDFHKILKLLLIMQNEQLNQIYIF